MEKQNHKIGIVFAVLAATLYAINSPFSKILLDFMPPTIMAGFLYLGAGVGMGMMALARRVSGNHSQEEGITCKELPYTIAMILLDVAAPIFLLLGLSMTTAANASLLNNFEIVATSFIALIFFGENISKRLWCGIAFITISCTVLTFEGIESLSFSYGSLFILLACICWGAENNCTRKLSTKDPQQIVILKGIFSGIGSLAIGFIVGERVSAIWSIFAVLLLGFVAYGLSIFFYVYAQRSLGAARTSAYYAIAPFIGTLISLIIFRKLPSYMYFIALILMIVGTWLSSSDKPIFNKRER